MTPTAPSASLFGYAFSLIVVLFALAAAFAAALRHAVFPVRSARSAKK